MDTHHATLIGRENFDTGDFVVLKHVKNDGPDSNSNENAANNQEITLKHKFFKEIMAEVPNIDEVHITGTGQIQKEFIRFLADTAQYKNVISNESTSNKMSDEELVDFMSKHLS